MFSFKKILAFALSISMVLTLIPAVTETAHAAGQASVKFIVRDVNDDGEVTETTAYCDDYINLSSLGDGESLKGGNWYVSKSGYKLFSSRVSIEGNDSVNIILTDGSEVEFMKGINASGGQTINIYGQERDSGKLTCTGPENAAAIGGSEGQSGGNINVFGGSITAKADGDGAGIGGGKDGSGGSFVMLGGMVTARSNGVDHTLYYSGGAGIGGGDEGDGGYIRFEGDSYVFATGGNDAAGIGGGDGGNGAEVVINGCEKVNVTAGFDYDDNVAIGGGEGSDHNGSLNISNTLKMDYFRENTASDPQSEFITKENRVSYAQSKHVVDFVPCNHSAASFEDYSDKYHRYECLWCYVENNPEALELHEAGEDGKCSVCKHTLKDISSAVVEPEVFPDEEYDGTAKVQSNYTVSDGSPLVEGEDYTVSYKNNINAGAATMVVTGMGAYCNQITKDFSIKPTSINNAKLAAIANRTYTGSKITPAKLTYEGKSLTSGKDFTASYSGNVNVGTAKVQISGKGNFQGTITKTFKILPKTATIKKPKAAKKAITVKWKAQKAKMAKSRITGYQVQAATDKSFTKNTKSATVKGYKKTSKKIKKLKAKKTYYVRVRTFMTVGGVTYYSNWSNIKRIKTK